MNIQDALGQFNGIDQWKDSEVKKIAVKAKRYTQQLVEGNISESEFNDLMSSLKTQKLILDDAADLQNKETLHKIIDITIQVAQVAASAI